MQSGLFPEYPDLILSTKPFNLGRAVPDRVPFLNYKAAAAPVGYVIPFPAGCVCSCEPCLHVCVCLSLCLCVCKLRCVHAWVCVCVPRCMRVCVSVPPPRPPAYTAIADLCDSLTIDTNTYKGIAPLSIPYQATSNSTGWIGVPQSVAGAAPAVTPNVLALETMNAFLIDNKVCLRAMPVCAGVCVCVLYTFLRVWLCLSERLYVRVYVHISCVRVWTCGYAFVNYLCCVCVFV